MELNWSSFRATAFRLRPGADLKSELLRLVNEHQWRAATVLTAVGSLSVVSLRFANQPNATKFDGKHEIVSLIGTLSQDGIHLHMSVADSKGQMFGGHVMDGSLINTTAEIVIGELSELDFKREHCPESGYRELVVLSRSDSA